MSFSQLLRAPKIQLAFLLLLIVWSTLLQYPLSFVTSVLVLALCSTVGSDLLFLYVRTRKLFIPDAAVVTGLILGLIVNPFMPWYGIFLISVIASASKHFIKISNRHVFNPAAIGLVVGNILLHDSVSWWGVSFQVLNLTPLHSIAFFVLLAPIVVSGMRMKRLGSVGAFFLTYSALRFLQDHSSPFALLTNPAFIFFSVVMLPEPMTSPIRLWRQIVYGVFVATISIAFSYLPFSRSTLAMNLLPDGLLPFLLIGNFVFFRFR